MTIDRAGLIFGILLSAGVTIVMGIMFFTSPTGTFRIWRDSGSSVTWHSTPGKVISRKIVVDAGRGHSRHRPVLPYSYFVDGKRYVNDHIAFDDPPNSTYSDAEAQALFDQHPPGTSVTVYYNPVDPSRSVLQRKSREVGGGLLFSLLILMVFGFCGSITFLGIRELLRTIAP